MKIKFLGTAAYEGMPALFCECGACKRAIVSGGRNIRTRTQALIDDQLLIDFPPDTLYHSQKYALDWTKIHSCLITHSHSDHLYIEDIPQMKEWCSHGESKLHFYSAEDGYNKIMSVLNYTNWQKRVAITKIKAGDVFNADGYNVLALPANHDADASPVFFAVEKNGKRILYAHDTGVFPTEAWKLLEHFGGFDLVSLDCTGGIGKFGEWRDGHLTLNTALEILAHMRSVGLANLNTLVVLNHFSHNCDSIYDELLPIEKEKGVIISFDGMELEI